MPYAVFVDQKDILWLTDFGSNAFVRFDRKNETFTEIRIPSTGANVRQILGVPGEIWGAESGTDKLISIKTGDMISYLGISKYYLLAPRKEYSRQF